MNNNEHYPYRAKQFLGEAQASFKRMQETKSIDELRRALLSFLNASRFCTQQLLTDFKGRLGGFDEWWSEKQVYLGKDDVCIFFKNLRNRVTKKGEDVLSVNFYIGKLEMNGPLQIGQNGIMVKREKGDSYEWTPHETSQLTILRWDLKNKPFALANISGVDLCKDYIKKLDLLFDEFVVKFRV
jgi:hypothetical protein